ncbi:hypothetical protein KGM_209697A, partial [Danaus plexippus plexippus]
MCKFKNVTCAAYARGTMSFH